MKSAGLAALIVAAGLLAPPAGAAPTGREIMERVDAREDGDNATQDLEMLLIDKNGNERLRKIRSQSRALLTNVVHFRAPWFEPFDPQATRPESFFLPSGELDFELGAENLVPGNPTTRRAGLGILALFANHVGVGPDLGAGKRRAEQRQLEATHVVEIVPQGKERGAVELQEVGKVVTQEHAGFPA